MYMHFSYHCMLVNFRSFAEDCHGKFLLGLLVFLGAARSTRVLQFDKKPGAHHIFLQPPAIDNEPESNTKMNVNQMV